MIFNDLISRYREFILYGIIGASCATFDFLVYTLILYLCPSLNVLIINTVSVICGITASFILNRQYNFKVKDRVRTRFLIFFSIGIIGLLISSLLIYIFVDFMNWNKSYAKLLTIFIVSIIQFLLNKKITFKTIKNGN